ncbi:Uma2 family endonuclease [Microcoleus sp. FACHB-1515]|uniref:Uma2 family endonuclease n=1 Tax=Cyanophyceae TaxID=3028117 RepID=UPI0028C47DE2|nr:Uma2 family endonuclease [Microcoleus sp. FACHB-1515]
MIQLFLPELKPGTVLQLCCSYRDYERMVVQRGNSSIPRFKYRNGALLIMVPLSEHGKNADVVPDIIKTLLDHQNQIYDSFTPITLTLPETSGIEPDHCFYITNWEAVQGKNVSIGKLIHHPIL